MKKDTFYFPHDYSCTNDPKIQALLGKHGATGYGVFWRLVEMLHEDPTHKLPLKKYIFDAVGSQLQIDPDLVLEIVQYLSDTCELFETHEEYFYSERVLENMEKRDAIREKRSFAGKKSAEIRQQNSTRVEQKPTKEIKVKKIKVKEIKDSIDFAKLLIFFNETFEKKCKVFPDSTKSKFRARLKDGYSQKDIAKAMRVCSVDKFHKDNNLKFCTIEYFSRSKTLDQYAFNESKQNKTYTPTT
jgi:hypothetical protein